MNSTSSAGKPRRQIRVVSYNILLGGNRREELIAGVLQRLDADVIALQEVHNLEFAANLATELDSELVIGHPSDSGSFHQALLSRLPIRATANHRHAGMLRGHLQVEVKTGGRHLPELQLNCLHLAARFGERANGEVRRMREIKAVLTHIDLGTPHLLMGDFNSIAPGDHVASTLFLRRIAELRRARLVEREANGLMVPRKRGGMDAALDAAWLAVGIDPRLDMGIPRLPSLLYRLGSGIPESQKLDQWLGRFIERRTVAHLRDLGYEDCFRRLHPRARGFTCATWTPAARIDYVFTTAAVAGRLRRCEVVGGRNWPDAGVAAASDHFPLVAEFAV